MVTPKVHHTYRHRQSAESLPLDTTCADILVRCASMRVWLRTCTSACSRAHVRVCVRVSMHACVGCLARILVESDESNRERLRPAQALCIRSGPCRPLHPTLVHADAVCLGRPTRRSRLRDRASGSGRRHERRAASPRSAAHPTG